MGNGEGGEEECRAKSLGAECMRHSDCICDTQRCKSSKPGSPITCGCLEGKCTCLPLMKYMDLLQLANSEGNKDALMLDEMYYGADGDGDGLMDISEMKELFKGFQPDPEKLANDMEELIGMYDSDKDGKLTREELF